jgi:hypothetical protein
LNIFEENEIGIASIFDVVPKRDRHETDVSGREVRRARCRFVVEDRHAALALDENIATRWRWDANAVRAARQA